MSDNATLPGSRRNSTLTVGQGLTPIPETADAGEPWTVVSVQPEATASGEKLAIGLTLVAPAAAHRAYRLAVEAHQREYLDALQQAHDSFLTSTAEGKRLAAVREGLALSERRYAAAVQQVLAAERAIRTSHDSGRDPGAGEQSLRKAREEVEVLTFSCSVAHDAVANAEQFATAALRSRVEAVRQQHLAESDKRFRAACVKLCVVASGPVLELIQALADNFGAQVAVADTLTKLPG